MTAPGLVSLKAQGRRIVAVTAYDYPSAVFADRAGVDVLLVGDSLGMTVLGEENTLGVTLEDMVRHTRAVTRARPSALVVADLPFLSYQISVEDGMRSAGRLLQEGQAGAVKLEGGTSVVPLIHALHACGIPVMGHLGLTPQSVLRLGGWKVQARGVESARALVREAKALEAAGIFALVLEHVPAEVAAAVTRRLDIPTIGIGAGPHCDGEVQVLHDLLGLAPHFKPRHSRVYEDLGTAMESAIRKYAGEVREGTFPGESQSFHEPGLAGDDWCD